jgi:hypothetical protein
MKFVKGDVLAYFNKHLAYKEAVFSCSLVHFNKSNVYNLNARSCELTTLPVYALNYVWNYGTAF